MVRHQHLQTTLISRQRTITLFLFLALIEQEENEQQQRQARFRDLLNLEGRRRRDRRVPRPSLNYPTMSAWTALFGSGNDQSLITVCGLDHEAFEELHYIFQPVFDNYTPFDGPGGTFRFRAVDRNCHPGGRPRSVTSVMCLGMCLMWTRTRGSNWNLGVIFGTTSSTTHVWIKFGMKLLVSIFMNHDAARVQLPTPEKVAEYKYLVNIRHPNLHHVYAVADGMKVYLQRAGNNLIQRQFYNGYKKDHFVSNVFAFAPDGSIIACSINCPGSWHYSTVANVGKFYSKLQSIWETCHGQVVLDSAFPKQVWNIISGRAPDPALGVLGVVIQEEATALRQSAEWGMRAFQASFPRVKDRLVYEEKGERLVYLQFITLLFNFRTRTVGLNQIQTTYALHLTKDANNILGGPPPEDDIIAGYDL